MHQKVLSSAFYGEQIFEWQHHFVVTALLTEGLEKTCLKYVSTHCGDTSSVVEAKLRMAAYIASSGVSKAYDTMVRYFSLK